MPIITLVFLTALLPLTNLLGKYNLPPMEKSIEDESTGLNVLPGFEVDLVYQVDKKKYGSWIAMAFDDKGRLTVSDQGGAGTFSIEIPKPGQDFDEAKIKKLNLKSSQWGWLGRRHRAREPYRRNRGYQSDIPNPLAECSLYLRLDLRHHVLDPPETRWILLYR